MLSLPGTIVYFQYLGKRKKNKQSEIEIIIIIIIIMRKHNLCSN